MKMGSKKILLCAFGAMVASAQALATPVTLFDNGAVVPSKALYNDAASTYVIYDDFVLGNAATVTSLVYHLFSKSPLNYISTNVSLFAGATDSLFANPADLSGLTGSQITSFNSIGSPFDNGLRSRSSTYTYGSDITLTGFSLNLGPGIYTLGFSTVMGNLDNVYIGIGSGSVQQTIGSGLFQVGPSPASHPGDHMAFTVIGDTSINVPEPATLGLVAAALLSLIVGRRRTLP
jgi:hypothetical protein